MVTIVIIICWLALCAVTSKKLNGYWFPWQF